MAEELVVQSQDNSHDSTKDDLEEEDEEEIEELAVKSRKIL